MADLTVFRQRLRWPVELFINEGKHVLESSLGSSAVDILMRDAFGSLADGDVPAATLEEILESADRVFVGIPAYWRQRTGRGASAARSAEWFGRSFASAVEGLRSRGYFDERMPPACPDGKRGLEITPSQFLDRVTGFEGLWQDLIRTPEYLEENLLYEVVEVLHDAASRPFSGWYHDWNNCGWHYEVFALRLARPFTDGPSTNSWIRPRYLSDLLTRVLIKDAWSPLRTTLGTS